MTPTRQFPAVFILGAMVLAANLLVFFVASGHPEARILIDSKEYLAAASNWVNHGVFYSLDLKDPIQLSSYTKRPPGYPVLIGIVQLLGGWIEVVVWIQVLLSLLVAYLVYRISSASGLSMRTAITTSMIVLLYPPQIIYSHLLMAEIPFQFLLMISVFGIFQFARKESAWYLVLANLALGMAVLTKPVLLYFWIPNLLFCLYLAIRHRRRALLLPALIPVLVISGWSYRNTLRTGYYDFTSIKSIVLQLRLPPEQAREFVKGLTTSDPEEYRRWNEEVQEVFIRRAESNLGRTLLFRMIGFAGFWGDPGRFDIYQINGLPHEIRALHLMRADRFTLWDKLAAMPAGVVPYLALMLLFNGIVAVAFAGFIFLGRLDRTTKIYIVLLVAYIVVATGTIGTSRYRLAVEPLLILGTAYSADRVRTWLEPRFRTHVD